MDGQMLHVKQLKTFSRKMTSSQQYRLLDKLDPIQWYEGIPNFFIM
jgi:hypothetical protein